MGCGLFLFKYLRVGPAQITGDPGICHPSYIRGIFRMIGDSVAAPLQRTAGLVLRQNRVLAALVESSSELDTLRVHHKVRGKLCKQV